MYKCESGGFFFFFSSIPGDLVNHEIGYYVRKCYKIIDMIKMFHDLTYCSIFYKKKMLSSSLFHFLFVIIL